MLLGNTNIELGAFGYGVYPLSDDNPVTGRTRPSENESIETIQKVADFGVRFFDTANAYCRDDSEEGYGEILLKKALANRPETVIATKGIAKRPGGHWELDGRPESMRIAVENSLRRLEVEAIQLYQVHGVDHKVPLIETVGELFKMQKEGKIQHIGLSNVDESQITPILTEGRIESIQNCLNPLYKRDLKNNLISFCKEKQITYIAYSPFGGFYSKDQSENSTLKKIAKERNCTAYDIAFSWILRTNDIVIPIPASISSSRVKAWIKASDIELSDSEMDEISKIEDKRHPYS